MRILFFSDMHFPYSKILNEELLKARDELFFSFLDRVFEMKSDMVISLGDLVLRGFKEEMDEVYDRVVGSFYHILGNHDRALFGLDELVDKKFRHGDSFFEFDLCDVILLETAKDKNSDDWGGKLTSSQILWLKSCVQTNTNKPLFIFAHHPVFDTVRKSNYDMYSISKSCEILPILRLRKNPVFYISGHTHTDDIIKDENLFFISTSCVIDARMVRILEISKDEILYKSIDLDSQSGIKYAKLLSQNLSDFNMSEFGVGGRFETNLRLKYG